MNTQNLRAWLLMAVSALAAAIEPSSTAVVPPAPHPAGAAPVAVPAPINGLPQGAPLATIDLSTVAGVDLVAGEWRYSDTRIVEVDFRSAGADGQPTGAANRTYDFTPKAGAAHFDDSAWSVIDPASLSTRRSTGRLCFNWYRIRVTIPERVGAFDPTGSTVVFATSIDDYAEVWVDGELPRLAEQQGGSVVAGWNATNRIIVGRGVRPGQQIQLAVFGINGPISATPTNYIWMRTAELLFYEGNSEPIAVPPQEVNIEVVRLDPAIDAIVPANAKLFKLAEGFEFIEGPVWSPDGYLLFSDPNANRIYRYTAAGELSVFRERSGYDGADIDHYTQPGSNGLTFDRHGNLLINEHGNRRVSRLSPDGSLEVLVDRYQGKRLNSPNDLVLRSDGVLYFTDPPFGLPRFEHDERKELSFSGVFRLEGGEARLLVDELAGPNGLAFSPDERFLYVGNWDPRRKVVMRYPVLPDGDLGAGEVFFDMTGAPGEEAIDGVKVDVAGNVYVSGPGGLWILSPDGKHLGTVVAPILPANFAWGDDGRTLYMTARSRLYRMPLNIPGAGVAAPVSAAEAIVRLDPRFDAIVPNGAVLERVADGFAWVEGPVWDRRAGHLLFSDIPNNAVFRWHPQGAGAELFLRPSGYHGPLPFPGREPGSNGLAIDAAGRLIVCEHGNRRISRIERDGGVTTIVDRYRGKRLNSPNDALFDGAGELIFTDPPFGLPQTFDDPGRELDFSGVFRLRRDGRLTLLTDELRGPNGIALSPDGSTLYVSNADPERPIWMAYPVAPDGTLGAGRVFFDAAALPEGPGLPDGIKTDVHGNLFAAGPGGIHVLAADATHLGSIRTGVATGNAAWGEDGSVLYITADTAIYRLATSTKGAGF